MTTIACFLGWTIALLLVPALILSWVFESRIERVQRWRSYGLSQQQIANRLGCSRYAVRKLLAA